MINLVCSTLLIVINLLSSTHGSKDSEENESWELKPASTNSNKPKEVDYPLLIGLTIAGVLFVCLLVSIPWIIIIFQKRFRIFFKNRLCRYCCCCTVTEEFNGISIGPIETVSSVTHDSGRSQVNDSQNPPLYENVVACRSNDNQQPPSYQNLEIDYQMSVLSV